MADQPYRGPDVKKELILSGTVFASILGGATGGGVFPALFIKYFAVHFEHGDRYRRAFLSGGPWPNVVAGAFLGLLPGLFLLFLAWITYPSLVRHWKAWILAVFLIGMVFWGVVLTYALTGLSGIA